MNRIVVIALYYAITAAGFGQVPNNVPNTTIWKPPQMWNYDDLPKSTISKELASKLRVSDMNIVLETTRMTDVQKRFGGAFGQDGDAGTSLEWPCLRGGDATEGWVLWLKSGEMDDGTVGSFQWQRVRRSTKFDERCGLLSKADEKVELPIPLNLGMPEVKLLQLFGQPTARHGNTVLYAHEHRGANQQGPFTTLNTLACIIRDGRVAAIDVLKVSFAD